MTPEVILSIATEALTIATMLAAPLLLSALATGVSIGVLQAATQINEMTLSFIPKLLVMVMALMVAGPWMLQVIINYTKTLYSSIPQMIG